jgi:hypothetical protein
MTKQELSNIRDWMGHPKIVRNTRKTASGIKAYFIDIQQCVE